MSVTLLSCWTRTVEASPDAPAIIVAEPERIVTRRELEAAASAWAERHRAGVRGQRVVLAEPNGVEWFRVFLGVLRAGGIVVPLDPGEPPAVQRATAAAIRAGFLWTSGGLETIARSRRGRSDGACLVKLTSGSTGTPRALAFTDAQMLADGRQICAGMGIGPNDLNFGLIPFGHSYGLGNLVMPLLLQGTAIVCGAAPLPQAMAEAIARWRPTVFPAVPAMLRALAVSDIPAQQLGSLRTIISAGAPLAPEIAGAFHAKFGLKVHSFYGSSETGGITYDRSGDAARTGRSVGTPLPGVRLVFGRGRRFQVESAAVVTIGRRRRAADGFGAHRPADLAELNADGELILRGRAGRFVKIAGRRLNLAEVEHALRQIPGVREAMVAAHSFRADALEAAVATEHPAEHLRLALQQRLAGWKIPKRIITLPSFPLTARGKTDTRALRAMLGGGRVES